MRFFRRLKSRILSRLVQEIDRERSGGQGADHYVLGAGSALLPEGEIHNFSGNPGDISIGRDSHVRGRLLTYGHGGKITIGDWCYIGVRSEIWSMKLVEIGNRVLIAHDVNIHDGTAHSLDATERHEHFRHIIQKGHPNTIEMLPGIYSDSIIIEDDVWISFGVTILRGVRIGRGSIIAAGSIVTRDVPAGMIYRNAVQPVLEPLNAMLANKKN